MFPVRPARQSESYSWTLLRHYPQHRVRHAGHFKRERRRSHGTGEPAQVNVCVGTSVVVTTTSVVVTTHARVSRASSPPGQYHGG